MPRTPARITQADIARAIRAAKQEGAHTVELRPDGAVLIQIAAATPQPLESPPDHGKPIVL
jgi:hypothetical protein